MAEASWAREPTAEIAALEPGRDGHILPRVFAPELELAGFFPDIDRLRELDELPVRRPKRKFAQVRQALEGCRVDLDPDRDHPVTFEDGRGRLAQHGRMGGRGDIVRRQAEPLRVGQPQMEADRGPGIDQPVENIDDSGDLPESFGELGGLFLEPGLIC